MRGPEDAPTPSDGIVAPGAADLYGSRRGPETDRKPRCSCGKVLAWHATRPWSIRCDRCGRTSGA